MIWLNYYWQHNNPHGRRDAGDRDRLYTHGVLLSLW
jgi:hypothetical protein